MKILTMTAVVLLAITAATPAFSQMMDMPMKGHQEGCCGKMGMGHMDRMGDMMGTCMEHAEMMGFTDDQLMKMKPVHNEMQKKQAQYEADLKIAEIELMEIMDVKDFDLEKANSAVRKIESLKTARQLETLKTMKKMRASGLTDEQFKKMNKMMFKKMVDQR